MWKRRQGVLQLDGSVKRELMDGVRVETIRRMARAMDTPSCLVAMWDKRFLDRELVDRGLLDEEEWNRRWGGDQWTVAIGLYEERMGTTLPCNAMMNNGKWAWNLSLWERGHYRLSPEEAERYRLFWEEARMTDGLPCPAEAK
jgi:hypothetical protein